MVKYPNGVPKEVEIPGIDMRVILEETTRKHPRNVALVSFNKRTTYRELDIPANRFASKSWV